MNKDLMWNIVLVVWLAVLCIIGFSGCVQHGIQATKWTVYNPDIVPPYAEAEAPAIGVMYEIKTF